MPARVQDLHRRKMQVFSGFRRVGVCQSMPRPDLHVRRGECSGTRRDASRPNYFGVAFVVAAFANPRFFISAWVPASLPRKAR